MIALYTPGELPPSLRNRFSQEAAYIEQFAYVPSTALIRNAATAVCALAFDDALMPVTIDSLLPGNSYVVSPCCAYVDYAQLELPLLPNPRLQQALRLILNVSGRWLHHVRLDDVIHINNWLLSTNLYPAWDGDGLPDITRFLIERFPDKAIAFRSLNEVSNSALLKAMQQAGYLLLPSRQIYLQDARDNNGRRFSSRRDFKHDARLFTQTGYRVCKPDPAHFSGVFERMEQLYRLLYLVKYPSLNPQFTSRWLENGHRDGWLNLYCLHSPEGSIDGVAGWLRRDRTMTTPVVGYDTGLPQSLGLYRMLTWYCLNEAIRNGCLMNSSAGAAAFKRSRGGVAQIEYSVVYARHLAPQSRFTWQALASLLNRFAPPCSVTPNYNGAKTFSDKRTSCQNREGMI